MTLPLGFTDADEQPMVALVSEDGDVDVLSPGADTADAVRIALLRAEVSTRVGEVPCRRSLGKG